MIPYAKYPGLSPLFLEFLAGLPEFYPDRPTVEAAAARGKQLLAAGRELLGHPPSFGAATSEGGGGHQVGLFTGPLFTLMKAFDAIHLARELSRRGVPAVPVFWALTDDHDLQEIAHTARPTPDGPQEFILEGADRQNRQPVGRLPIPEGVRPIVEAFRPDARDEDAARMLDASAARSAPGTSYGEAFIETLLDLVDPDPLLVIDPLGPSQRAPTVALFLEAARKEQALRATLRATAEALQSSGRPIPAPVPEGFSFFAIDQEGRRRIEDVPGAVHRVEAGEAWPSADVITRPILKSYLFPMAASVLGAAEIAYHAQSLPLFALFGVAAPVLIPRTHLVLRGPAERRLSEQLGIAEEDLLGAPAAEEAPSVPEADAVARLAQETADRLAAFHGPLQSLDASLAGALDTAGKKIAYQFDQLADRARKAVERKGSVAANRRKRLAQALMPGGIPAERVYPPLAWTLAWGRGFPDALRGAAGASTEGATVIDLGADGPEGGTHAG